MTSTATPLTQARSRLDAFTRALGAAGVVGLLVGIPAGLLARLIMKVAALAAGPSALGRVTENGNIVGALTANGTLALVIFAGILPVIGGAILYLAVRPWLLPLTRWRGFAFGAYLLAIAGAIVLDPLNGDFVLFGPAALNVAMFSAIFIAVGVAVVPVTEASLAWLSRGQIALVGLGLGLAGLYVLFLGAFVIGTISSWLAGIQTPLVNTAVILVVVSMGIGLLARTLGTTAITYTALAVPLALSAWITGGAIAELLR